ncbi:NUDIX hydrolase [Microlunatus soli]|uniref:NUDIX hydrolase n=1 Tax=Microlunatus soli TaxID=630515 RepID=UPI000B849F62
MQHRTEEEVAAAVLVRDGKLLLGHRHPQRRAYPDVWDLIGGHIEPGETADDAVRRECREELAITIHRARPIEIPFQPSQVILHGFLITTWDGDPVNAALEEHDAIGWFTAAQLRGLRLVDHTYSAWLAEVIASGSPTPRAGR